MSELNAGRMLARASVLYGARPAVKDLSNGHDVTYAEHVQRVGRLCEALAALGIGPTDRVGILAGNSHAYIEVWHASLAGGCVINPLNGRLAPDELVYILTDSETSIVFCDAGFAPVVAEIRKRVPTLETVVLIGDGDVEHDARYSDLLAAAATADLPTEPAADAPGVLMYTGGTTGRPKGVVLSHKAIALSIYRMQTVVDLGGVQRHLAFMPMFHVGGMTSWGFLLPTGGSVVVLPAFEPGRVNTTIAEEAITNIGAVPTMLAMMLNHPEFDPPMLASLELIMYGAASMPPELLDSLMSLYPALNFHQAYGMTEICALATGLTRSDHRRGGAILRSVGRPCLGVDLQIRDPDTAEPVPAGDVGEIWSRSDSLLDEYWNKPEQTAESLVEGWYRSGDAGRVDAEGYLFLADRVKDMIVTGGENVYSIEVENAISSHPAVQAVAVIGLVDETWGERVHAVVVCDPDAVTAGELAAHARATIAGFKVPKTWTLQSDPLPLSAAAKVLKRELRERLAEPSA